MARSKKTRNIKDVLPMRKAEQPQIKTKTSNTEPKAKRKKGLPSGSRHNITTEVKTNFNLKTKQDPRLGSKRKIELVVNTKEIVQDDVAKNSREVIQKNIQEPNIQALQKELFNLENNAYFNKLLDAMDQGQKLNKEEQAFVDQTIIRCDEIMELLGITDVPEEDNDIDLLSKFNQININDFK